MKFCKFSCAFILMSMIGLSFSFGNENIQPFDSDHFYHYNLFARGGKCFLVGVTRRHRITPIQPSLPSMPSVPSGRIDTQEIERWKDRPSPFYTEHLSKYPELVSREKELWKSESDRSTHLRRYYRPRPFPRYQAAPEWIDFGVFRGQEMYKTDLEAGEMSKIIPRLGALRKGRPYFRRPVSSLTMLDVRQPRADMIKPFLFYAGDRFYSVYGDTQVAEHVPVEDHPEYLAALRHPGNILYGYSEELPPALQACGMDGDGYLWLADLEGHIAFFNTNTNEFIQKILRKEDADRVRIARDNCSSSVFISKGEDKEFKEYSVRISADPAFSTPTGLRRRLPANTEQILYSDRNKVIAVFGEGELLKLKDRELQYLSSGAPHDEYIVEGLYNPDTGVASLLVAEKWRKDVQWNTLVRIPSLLRLIRISVSEDKKLESRLPNISGE